MSEQKKQYETKLKSDQQFEQIRQRMKDIRKDVAEANEIAKFMNKDVIFTDTYVTKLDDQSAYGG
jgi:TPP-dependent pyruvate/acetoin dehydrogenase alpha subunit